MENANTFTTGKILLNPDELEIISNPSLSLCVESESFEVPNIIYGRMLSGKSVNKVGLKKLFESLWQNKAGVKIEDYTEGIVTLTFESEAVKNRLMRGQPWHFGGSYLILIEIDAMAQITPELFKHIPFWIQVYGLPPGLLMNPYGEKLGEDIANSIGKFMEFDPNYRQSFLRIRVNLDSSKPLMRGKFLKLSKQKDKSWIFFRYERLFKFCHFCGHLDHVQKDCAALMEEMESGQNPSPQYNESIKTAGLPWIKIPDTKLSQFPNGKLVSLADNVEASRTSPKEPSIDLNAKRQKLEITNNTQGDTDAIKGATDNVNKQKVVIEGGKSLSPNTFKSVPKGTKANSPTLKQVNRGQNAPSDK